MNLRVDWRESVALTGTVLKYLSLALVVPLTVALVYGDGPRRGRPRVRGDDRGRRRRRRCLERLDSARVGYVLTPLEAISASIATIGNIGPGFGTLGPFGSYLEFPTTSKLVMILLMWIGRLEISPVLVLFTGPFRKR